ncbi:MAG: polyprenyl synthetase family protein [Clostridiales bacterium]|jgi:geranylgeranyl diphosphate synthase type II|nr:polyprenyl synthetase family protein [Clostridiales bacterium]MDR2713091.1 polyprenyl synthetase family protein [Clostridiales bacterium]
MQLKEYMDSIKCLVEGRLDELLPEAPDSPEAVLYRAMRYSVLGGGKRLRAIIFLATCDLFGLKQELYLDFACALEMLQTYSLIHDDLPAMDNDDYRRGQLTCHKVFGEAQAILAGDALLTQAFNLMLSLDDEVDRGLLCQAARQTAWLLGLGGMVRGQAADMALTGQDPDLPLLQYIHYHKTGAFFQAAIKSGAIFGQALPREMEALCAYSERIGLLFQVVDDILDLAGDEQVLGKPPGSDKRNSKITYPSLIGLEKARKLAEKTAEEAKAALEIFGSKVWFFNELPAYLVKRSFGVAAKVDDLPLKNFF